MPAGTITASSKSSPHAYTLAPGGAAANASTSERSGLSLEPSPPASAELDTNVPHASGGGPGDSAGMQASSLGSTHSSHSGGLKKHPGSKSMVTAERNVKKIPSLFVKTHLLAR